MKNFKLPARKNHIPEGENMDNRTRTWLIIGGVIVGIIIIVPLIYWLIGGGQGYGYGMMAGGIGAM
jgi:hypothetical protein